MAKTQKLTAEEFELVSRLTSALLLDDSFDIAGDEGEEEYWDDFDDDDTMSLEEGFELLSESIAYSFQHEGFSDDEAKTLENVIKRFVPDFEALDPADD